MEPNWHNQMGTTERAQLHMQTGRLNTFLFFQHKNTKEYQEAVLKTFKILGLFRKGSNHLGKYSPLYITA